MRIPGCHARCAVYQAWRKRHDEVVNRMRAEAMLDGHSDWCGYDRIYWDRPVNQARQREMEREAKRDEAKRERRRQEKIYGLSGTIAREGSGTTCD